MFLELEGSQQKVKVIQAVAETGLSIKFIIQQLLTEENYPHPDLASGLNESQEVQSVTWRTRFRCTWYQ